MVPALARVPHGGGFPRRGASLLSVAARPLRGALATLTEREREPRAPRDCCFVLQYTDYCATFRGMHIV